VNGLATGIGFSAAARQSQEGLRRSIDQLRTAQTFSIGQAFGELGEVFGDCRHPNWDGHGAEPVSQNTMRVAYCFIEAIPLGTSGPSVGADPDGHLSLEWYRHPRKILSVSIDEDGDLHYAAIIGPSQFKGTTPFLGEVPGEILGLISRVST